MYFFELWFSLGVYLGMGLLDHMVTLFLVFRGTSILFSTVAAPTSVPTNRIGEFPFKMIF